MTWTPNVPQGNQKIAATTDPIRNNFTFTHNVLQQEHQFDGNVPGLQEGIHLKASMPNQADPSSLPSGANGMYYVSGGLPKFYNGNAFTIQVTNLFQFQTAGNVSLSLTPNIVFTMPPNSCGYYFLIPPSGIPAANASAMGFIVSSDSSIEIGAVSDPGISLSSSGLSLLASTTSVPFNGLYKFALLFFTP